MKIKNFLLTVLILLNSASSGLDIRLPLDVEISRILKNSQNLVFNEIGYLRLYSSIGDV